LFRLAAVALALAPFFAAEMFLRAMDWGKAADYDDPFVGFTELHPLFVLSDDGRRYEIPASRQDFFRPESFAAEKGAREFRIFCLGGSTVQGNPYGIETSFTTWLELSLTAADPSRQWQVVNCGGISYASYRLAPILKELLAYQPDLVILYSGHNEFLEDRTYEHIKNQTPWMRAAGRLASHSRLCTLVGAAGAKLTAEGPSRRREQLPAEVDALLDHGGALKQYRRDDARAAAIVAHYESNLRRMIAMAQEAGVPVILCDPVSNLNDCPPFKSENREDLSADEQAKFETLWQNAYTTEDRSRREELLREAIAIDDRHAAAHYHLAQCLQMQGRFDEARIEYLRAKDEDLCPLRILEPMHLAVRRVAADTGTPLAEVRRLFEEASPHGIPGEKLLIDHVHPRIRGHKMIADLLLAEMFRQGWAKPVASWQEKRDELYQEHTASLDYGYFVRGEEHLEGLRLWAQGRAKPRPRRDSEE
jgi:hypothetical protein